MKMNRDWVVRNWNFLTARTTVLIPNSKMSVLFQDSDAPTTGKFFGTDRFYYDHRFMAAQTRAGGKRIAAHAFIEADMPEGVSAVYIDPKRYRFNTAGDIVGLNGTYELPVYIFKE